MRDVRAAGVDVMTFGQYMRPTKRHMPVSEYVTPEGFEVWRKLGEDMVRLLLFNLFLRVEVLLMFFGRGVADSCTIALCRRSMTLCSRGLFCLVLDAKE